MSDGNLRTLEQKNMPEAFWIPVETWSTGQGVPDVHYIFPHGITGWIENKLTKGWAVHIEKEQSAWIERYTRQGGRAFVAVRRVVSAGPRKPFPADELWLFRGADVRLLMVNGLKGAEPLGTWERGPAAWDWQAVRTILHH